MKPLQRTVLSVLLASVLGPMSAQAAVTCIHNTATGKFEEKAHGRHVTGECDAQTAMNMVSSVADIENVVSEGGTKVIGGVIVTNAPKFAAAVESERARKAEEAKQAELAKQAEIEKKAEQAKAEQLAEAKAASDKAAAAAAAPKPAPTWTLTAGRTIGQELQAWGAKAGWKVIWSMQKDWAVPASTVFTGEFKTAASDVIKNLASNGALIRAQFYDGNKTLVVVAPGVTPQ